MRAPALLLVLAVGCAPVSEEPAADLAVSKAQFWGGWSGGGGSSGASTSSANTWTAAQTFDVSPDGSAIIVDLGDKLCMNGSTCTNYITAAAGQTTVSIGGSSGLLLLDTSMSLLANGATISASNAGGAQPVFINDVDGLRIGDGTGTDADGPVVAGSIQLNIPDTAQPACASGTRGTVWYNPGGAGVADAWEVCRKDAGDAYAWVAIY